MKVLFKRVDENAKLPTRGSAQAIGYDVYAYIPNNGSVIVSAHGSEMISLGISAVLPDGVGAFLMARSGLACKHGIRPSNCVGLIDPDYRGEWKMSLRNDTDKDFTITHGDRIGQVVFKRAEFPEFSEVDELPTSDRGEGGFGSTGK